MKKNLKIGLYDPYLDTLGGGEKHILSILQVLADEGYEINIFWDKDLTKQIKNRFSLQFINKSKFLPNVFKIKPFAFSTLKNLQTLRTFDYIFYVTDGSYFFSTAKNNFCYIMIPDKNLLPLNLTSKLKTINYKFITHSRFVQRALKQWKIKSDLVYPYIDEKLIFNFKVKIEKEKIILSVGRFFSHLHSKRQDLMINSFKKLKQENTLFKDFKLILAGGLKEEDKKYFEQLKKSTNNDPSIIFKPNIPLNELYKLYELSNFFWHFTGFGVDENIHPEQVEHLGIAPLEAMAAGCLTFCYNAGGLKEIITDGQNGFLFNNEKELILQMSQLVNNHSQQQKIRQQAHNYINQYFSYNVFKTNVHKILNF